MIRRGHREVKEGAGRKGTREAMMARRMMIDMGCCSCHGWLIGYLGVGKVAESKKFRGYPVGFNGFL